MKADLIGQLVQELSEQFQWISDTPRLDAQLLIAHCLGVDRTYLMLNPHLPVQTKQLLDLEPLVQRRFKGECLAYLLEKKDFFAHTFSVGPGVLVPRPETEILVEWILEDYGPLAIDYRDVCTGTACIPISLSFMRPQWRISASDISTDALFWATKNVHMLKGPAIEIICEDLLNSAKSSDYHVISANPPYVPHQESLAKIEQGWTEPQLALDGGPDGLGLYPRLFNEAYRCLKPGGKLYIEIGDGQHQDLDSLAKKTGFSECQYRQDLQGLIRTLRLSK